MVNRLEEELEGVVRVRERLMAVLQEVEAAIHTNALLQDELQHETRHAIQGRKKIQRECCMAIAKLLSLQASVGLIGACPVSLSPAAKIGPHNIRPHSLAASILTVHVLVSCPSGTSFVLALCCPNTSGLSVSHHPTQSNARPLECPCLHGCAQTC